MCFDIDFGNNHWQNLEQFQFVFRQCFDKRFVECVHALPLNLFAALVRVNEFGCFDWISAIQERFNRIRQILNWGKFGKASTCQPIYWFIWTNKLNLSTLIFGNWTVCGSFNEIKISTLIRRGDYVRLLSFINSKPSVNGVWFTSIRCLHRLYFGIRFSCVCFYLVARYLLPIPLEIDFVVRKVIPNSKWN